MPSITTAAFRRGRRIAAASVVAVAAFSLTACNAPGGDDPKPAKSPASEAPGNASSGGAGAAGGDTGSTGAGSSGAGSSGSRGSGTSGSGSSGSQGSAASTGGSGSGHHGSGTSGGSGSAGSTGSTGSGGGTGTGTGHQGGTTTLNGTLKYLAPGKYTVAPESGMEQAFFVATDTRILGATTICGGPDGRVTIDKGSYGTTTCTTDDLEKAAKKNTVKVRVTVRKGVAAKVVEHYHP
ncbi:hypothetical protein CP973_04060 [Streptomyces albofaciens JCM 4342]|uniref:hypothetical protein n=1 Tax=Streptomyces albofaciens TaxID=66866 RepID=UPI001238C776|nr:hypothetical protein [Streptomyces albofaciens]KAA6221260.1 hypothetical protein CP973_04060 [Streptomyces albofaciens JCM 4342]